MSKTIDTLLRSASAPAPKPTQMTLCGDDYLLVPALKREGGSASDVKDVVPNDERKVPSNPARIVRMPRMKNRSKDPFFTEAVLRITATSSANTALAVATSLVPSAADGWSSFAVLFDAARVSAIKVDSTLRDSASPTVTICDWACGFDPGTGSSGVPTSVSDVLSDSFHFGPITNSVSQSVAATQTQTRTGFHKWSAITEKNFESGLTADLVGGNWFPVVPGGSAIVGYIRTYADAIGGTGTTTVVHYVRLQLEFRYRQ